MRLPSLFFSLLLPLTSGAQTTYFEQNFSAGGTPASYVSATPGSDQVNGMGGLSATITNNAVQFVRPTDSGTGYMARSANFTGTPTSLHVQFSFEVISSDPSATGTSAVIFYVGSGFNSGPQNPANGDVYARMALNLSPTTSGEFQVRTQPTGGGGANSAGFSGKQRITFAMNKSESSNFTYVSPTGSMEPLPNDTYDIWVGGSRVFNDEPVLTPSQAIANFKFRINNGVGVIQIGDILMREIAGPLPVTLLSFTAKPDGNRVQLAWTTTEEQNADRFIVERSTDLSEFALVGEVPAKGTTTQRQDYGLTDPNPTPGTNYYRLKQRDFDGTTTLFKPVSAIIRTDEPAISAYPSPADADRIHLRLWNADGAAVRLLNVLGQTIPGQLDRTPGEADFRPAQPLIAGLYLVEVTAGQHRRVWRVLVH